MFPLTSPSTAAPVAPNGQAATSPVVAPVTDPTGIEALISVAERATDQMRTSARCPLIALPPLKLRPMEIRRLSEDAAVPVPVATEVPLT